MSGRIDIGITVEAVDALNADALVDLATQTAALHARAMARLMVLRGGAAPTGNPSATGRALTAREAAARLGVSPQTLYRRARSYPFTRRVTGGPRGALRFDEGGLERWLAQRRL